MADARHRFLPSKRLTGARAPRRTAASVFSVRSGVAWTLALAAAFYLVRPLFSSSVSDNPRTHFASRGADFRTLKDMITAETSVTSVGPDNLREYWLFDGRWSSPRRPGAFLTRREMLKEVGMPPDRYEDYLSLLKSVGAYRVARTGNSPDVRVVVRMLPNRGGTSTRLVYDIAGANTGRSSHLGEHWYLEPE
jgi:hypothetical protein